MATNELISGHAHLPNGGRKITSEAPALRGVHEQTTEPTAPDEGGDSVVLSASNDGDKSTSIFRSRREFEAALRERLGLSRAAAKAVAGGGWPALSKSPDEPAADAVKAKLLANIERLTRWT